MTAPQIVYQGASTRPACWHFSKVSAARSTLVVVAAFTPFGVLGLSDPIELLWQGPTDANGRVELALGGIGNVAGLTVHVQAIDFLVPALTNYFTIVVQ